MKRVKAYHRRGIAMVYTAVIGLALIGMLGLALDTARVLLVAHELQTAADASSLAGASNLPLEIDNAKKAAMDVAALNNAEGVSIKLGSADLTIGDYDRSTRTFTPNEKQTWVWESLGVLKFTAPRAVKVRAPRTAAQNGGVPLIFGESLAQVSKSNVSRQAIAMIESRVNVGVIVMNLHDPLSMAFNGKGSEPKIEVRLVDSFNSFVGYGGIVVNSDSPTAFDSAGNVYLNISDFWVGSKAGTAAAADATSVTPPDGDVHTGSTAVTDPFKTFLPGPPPKPASQANKLANGTWQAGYWPTGIHAGEKLGPGLHWVDGGISGSVDASAGCFIFVNSGDVDLGGGGLLKIRRITRNNASSFYTQYLPWTSQNLSLWVYKGNVTIGGNADLDNDGAVYLSGQAKDGGGHLELKGTPSAIGSFLVTDTVSMSGTGTVKVSHQAAEPNVSSVFLVE